MPLLAVLVQAAEETQINWVQVILAAALGVVIAGLVFRRLPPLIVRAVHKLDVWIVGDLSVLDRPAAILGTTVFIGWVLFGAAVSIANGLGVDTTGINAWLLDFGGDVGGAVAGKAVQIAIIVGITYFVFKAVQRAIPNVVRGVLKDRARPGTEEEELQKRETTLSKALVGGVRWLAYLTAGFAILSEIGINITPMLAAAGVVGIAVGLGAQSLVKDMLAGLFIILEDQYRVHDWVEIAGQSGSVEDVNLRRTVIRAFDYSMHVIPNGSIGVVANHTKEKARVLLSIPIAYKEDVDRCMELLNEIGKELSEDPDMGPQITAPITALRIGDFADSSVNILCLGQTKPGAQWGVTGEFRRRVKYRFDELGIEIPFPHQTIYWGADQPPFHPPAEGEKP